MGGYVCTRCRFGVCRREIPDRPSCGDLACECECEPYEEEADEEA